MGQISSSSSSSLFKRNYETWSTVMLCYKHLIHAYNFPPEIAQRICSLAMPPLISPEHNTRYRAFKWRTSPYSDVGNWWQVPQKVGMVLHAAVCPDTCKICGAPLLGKCLAFGHIERVHI